MRLTSADAVQVLGRSDMKPAAADGWSGETPLLQLIFGNKFELSIGSKYERGTVVVDGKDQFTSHDRGREKRSLESFMPKFLAAIRFAADDGSPIQYGEKQVATN